MRGPKQFLSGNGGRGKFVTHELRPHAPPYIIWGPANTIYRYDSLPNKPIGYSAGALYLRATQYPTRSVAYYSAPTPPPGFSFGPPVMTV